jgi:hypothetical protein
MGQHHILQKFHRNIILRHIIKYVMLSDFNIHLHLSFYFITFGGPLFRGFPVISSTADKHFHELIIIIIILLLLRVMSSGINPPPVLTYLLTELSPS